MTTCCLKSFQGLSFILVFSAIPQESSDESTQSRRLALEERCSQLESQLFAKSIEASDRKTQLDSLESAFRSRVDEIETQLSATTALKRAREEEILMLKSKIAAMEKPTRPSVRNFRSQIGPPNCSLKPLSTSSNGCVQTDLSSVHHELQKQVFEKQSTATMTSPYLNQSQPAKSDTIIVRLRKDILEKSKQISDLEETCATAADAIRSLQDQIRQQNDCCARRISELQASMAANTPPGKHVHTEGCQTESPVFTNRGIDARSPGTCDSACQVDLDAHPANAPSVTNTSFPGFISEALLTLESTATFDRAISAATNSTAQGDTVQLSRQPVHAAPKSGITTEAATELYQGSSVNLGSHFGEVSQPAVRPTTVSETEDSWLHVVTSPQECDARPGSPFLMAAGSRCCNSDAVSRTKSESSFPRQTPTPTCHSVLVSLPSTRPSVGCRNGILFDPSQSVPLCDVAPTVVSLSCDTNQKRLAETTSVDARGSSDRQQQSEQQQQQQSSIWNSSATLIHDSERMVFSTSPSPWLPSGEEDAESLGSLSDCADFQLTVPPLLGFSSPEAQTTTTGAVEGVRVVTHSTIVEEGPVYLSSSKHASLCADQTAMETWNASTDAKANTFVSHCPTATASGVNSVPGNEASRRVDLVVGQPSSHSVNDDITESPLQQISNFFDAAPPSSDEEDWDPHQVAAKFLADERSHSARLEKMLEWHLQSLRASSDLEFTARADLVTKPTRVTVEPTFAPTSSSEAPWLLADELRVGNDCTTVFVGVSN
ncbi:hypothetical protein SprV_0100095600 [Sparganum proliferum]